MSTSSRLPQPADGTVSSNPSDPSEDADPQGRAGVSLLSELKPPAAGGTAGVSGKLTTRTQMVADT